MKQENLSSSDQRRVRRQRVFKGALLRFDSGYGSRECLVRNLSTHGARLSFGDVCDVPVRFDVRLSDSDVFRPATVRWRRGGEMGIAFADA